MVAAPAALAKHRRLPVLLVLQSFEVGRVARFGWEASPWITAAISASEQDATGTKRAKHKPEVVESAGQLSIVAISGDQESVQALAISCPHPGVVKYDPLVRREWLELIDLVCLKTRVAETILRKVAGSAFQYPALLGEVTAACTANGLEAALVDAKQRLQHKVTRATSLRRISNAAPAVPKRKAVHDDDDDNDTALLATSTTTIGIGYIHADRAPADRFKAGRGAENSGDASNRPPLRAARFVDRPIFCSPRASHLAGAAGNAPAAQRLR